MNSEDFPAILEQIMSGKIDLPNFEEVEIGRGVSSIAAGGSLASAGGVKYARVPGQTIGQWARFFLSHGQGGTIEGSGYVMLYGGGKGRIARFAICKHKKIADAGADPRRGWHPGHCELCGLDMTVDSGD